MPRQHDTRGRMLFSAAAMFTQHGYHGTGMKQLVAAGNAPRGSLYHFFPGGKEQLAAEAMRSSSAALCGEIRNVLADAPDPGTAVERVVEMLGAALQESGFRLGCPLATVALEVAADSEPIRAACAEGYDSWHTVIADDLRQRDLSDNRADELATVVLACIEGGLLLARTHRDLAPLRGVATHLRTTLEREAG